MIDRTHKLSVTRQAKVLAIPRSTVYYRSQPVSDQDLALMRRLDHLHLDYPFAGARMLRDLLQREHFQVDRKHVSTLMKRMGIQAVYRKPRTSQRDKGHKIYPYLLRGMAIHRPNQVWATDITYIPMARGFVYLVAIVDWYSRRVLAWRLSNTLTTDFCVGALEDALSRYGKPDIFNTDQGCQFTSEGFTSVLKKNNIRISMDGKGRWRDNVFVERLWRSVKYEEVYLHAYESVSQAKAGLERYFIFYNSQRPHSALGRMTPDQIYYDTLPLPEVA